MNLKKMERYLRVNLLGPGRGLTEVEKRCSTLHTNKLNVPLANQNYYVVNTVNIRVNRIPKWSNWNVNTGTYAGREVPEQIRNGLFTGVVVASVHSWLACARMNAFSGTTPRQMNYYYYYYPPPPPPSPPPPASSPPSSPYSSPPYPVHSSPPPTASFSPHSSPPTSSFSSSSSSSSSPHHSSPSFPSPPPPSRPSSSSIALQSNAYLRLLNALLPVSSVSWPLFPVLNFALINMFVHCHARIINQ